MSQPVRTAAALAIGALLIAVVALTIRPAPAVGAPATDGEPAVHTITVTASGSVTLVPDVARVTVGVTATKSTVKAVRAATSASMSDVIASLKAMGIAERDIRTTSIDLSPQYSTGSTPKITGYRMSQQLQVTVRDLDKAGDVIDTAAAKGANEVNGLWFEVDDPSTAMDEARAAAIARARTSAQAMAAAAGVHLGEVLSIAESSASYPMPYANGAGARDIMETPVQPGTQDVQATVTVVFEIS